MWNVTYTYSFSARWTRKKIPPQSAMPASQKPYNLMGRQMREGRRTSKRREIEGRPQTAIGAGGVNNELRLAKSML
jgi:hypothetical protein